MSRLRLLRRRSDRSDRFTRFPVHRGLRDRLRALLAAGSGQLRELRRWRSAGEPIDARAHRLRRANEEFVAVALELEDFIAQSFDGLVAERIRAQEIGPDSFAALEAIVAATGTARSLARLRGVETRAMTESTRTEETP